MSDKHTWLAENVLANVKAAPKPSKKIAPIQYKTATRKTKVVLAILGCWGVYFPPYNLARLSALTREAGYNTKVFDFNVDGYHDLAPYGLKTAWDATHHYWWTKEEYFDRIHPHNEALLRKYIDKVLAENPDVLGVSIYDTNVVPTEWFTNEIKRLRPDITIIAGGPNCHAPDYMPAESIDYFVRGEGEQVLMDFLEGFEAGQLPESRQLGSTYSMQRINIDTLPFPDYTDYDFSKYTNSGGISAEISRGCVAKCSFCKETWFWKFRDRDSVRILDEIETQYNQYGVSFIWFIDSLTNGNLKELRLFAQGVVERGLDIHWMGYARCDGRMDLDYYKDLKASGCVNLSYGIESGSQKVLDLMRKNITIQAVNENLINASIVGIQSHANWIVGAPGEDIQAMAHSMNLVWNHRYRIHAISPGSTLGDAKQTDYEFNRDRYNMSPWDKQFLHKWWSLDWSNTKIHRFIRLKLFEVWLAICKQYGTIENSQYRPKVHEFYSVTFDDPDYVNDEIPYEDIDHNIMKPNFNEFADSVVNEIWGFARMLWRAKGGYEFTTEFDPTYDHNEFGYQLADNYTAKHYIKVDKEGNFYAKHSYKFIHEGEWWMRGTRSFEYTWEGTGKWDENGVVFVNTIQESGSTDDILETMPMDANPDYRFINKGTTKLFTAPLLD